MKDTKIHSYKAQSLYLQKNLRMTVYNFIECIPKLIEQKRFDLSTVITSEFDDKFNPCTILMYVCMLKMAIHKIYLMTKMLYKCNILYLDR